MKKFYIKKSPSDLIQEQNRLLKILLEKQDDKPSVSHKPVFDYKLNSIVADDDEIENLDLEYDLEYDAGMDEILFIPMTKETGDANLPSLDVEKSIFENDNVEKLRQTIKLK